MEKIIDLLVQHTGKNREDFVTKDGEKDVLKNDETITGLLNGSLQSKIDHAVSEAKAELKTEYEGKGAQGAKSAYQEVETFIKGLNPEFVGGERGAWKAGIESLISSAKQKTATNEEVIKESDYVKNLLASHSQQLKAVEDERDSYIAKQQKKTIDDAKHVELLQAVKEIEGLNLPENTDDNPNAVQTALKNFNIIRNHNLNESGKFEIKYIDGELKPFYKGTNKAYLDDNKLHVTSLGLLKNDLKAHFGFKKIEKPGGDPKPNESQGENQFKTLEEAQSFMGSIEYIKLSKEQKEKVKADLNSLKEKNK